MTTDEMLIEIVNYKYEAYGFPFVFLDYNYSFKRWAITWRNPAKFTNSDLTYGSTPNEACKNALEFIKSKPKVFTKPK